MALLASIILVLGLAAIPATSWADDADQQIQAYVEEAEEDYDMLYFEEAVETIQEGLSFAESQGIRNEDVATLYILLGLIRHADGDDSLALDAFVQAIEISPGIEIDPFYRTPATEELMEQAAERAEPPTDDPSPDIDDPPPEDEVDPLSHTPIRRADAHESLTVVAEIPADLPVFRVHLHHRRFGEEEFTEEEMQPTDATGFAFTLDASQVRSSQLEYFLTAIDRSGEVVAESGRRTNPHRLSVIGDTGTEDPDDDPDDPDAPPIDDPDDPTDPDATGFYGVFALGTDIGFLPGGTAPTANPDRSVSPGLVPAFAHTFLNLGWRISENNAVGLYFRTQFSPAQDFDAFDDDHFNQDASFFHHEEECFGFGLPGDCLLGLRYQRVVSAGVPEFFSTVGFGIGRVRNWLELKQTTTIDDPDPACEGREILHDPAIGNHCKLRDTVRTGWTHFGVGGGMHFPLSGKLDLVTDSYLMILVPDTSVNLDINVGLRLRL